MVYIFEWRKIFLLIIDDLIMYCLNKKILLKLIRKFSKVVRFKINIIKEVIFFFYVGDN